MPISDLVWRVNVVVAPTVELYCVEFDITHGLMTWSRDFLFSFRSLVCMFAYNPEFGMVDARIQCRSEKWKIQMPNVLVLVNDLMYGCAVVFNSKSIVDISIVKPTLSFLLYILAERARRVALDWVELVRVSSVPGNPPRKLFAIPYESIE